VYFEEKYAPGSLATRNVLYPGLVRGLGKCSFVELILLLWLYKEIQNSLYKIFPLRVKDCVVIGSIPL